MNTNVETAIISALAASGVVGGFFTWLSTKRTNATLEKNKRIDADSVMIAKHIDDRIDLSHTQQTMFDSLRAEFKDFKESSAHSFSDLVTRSDRMSEKWEAQSEELRQTKSALDRANLQIERQQTEIAKLQDSERVRKIEYEAMLDGVQTENVGLRSERETMRGQLVTLRAEVDTLRTQVQGNTNEIRTIGLPELKSSDAGPF